MYACNNDSYTNHTCMLVLCVKSINLLKVVEDIIDAILLSMKPGTAFLFEP